VVHESLSAEVLQHLQEVLRPHVAPGDGSGWTNDIVFRNTDLRTLSYNSSTGEITYSDTVDLSGVQVGDVLILRNQEWVPGTAVKGGLTREPIVAVDDANDKVTIAKGLDLNLGAANIWNGAIARGNKVLTNDDLVTFSYDADGTNPGRVTYSSNMNFSQLQVQVGYVFVDSSGNEYRIIDRDTSGNGAWVTISPSLRSVDDSVPTTKHGGSIETNNNPYDVDLEDCKVLLGAEFVPYDYPGPLEQKDITLTQLGEIDLSYPNPLKRHAIVPYDKRVSVWMTPSDAGGSGDWELDDDNNKRSFYGSNSTAFVEFVGVCTGLVPLIASTASSTVLSLWVDGWQVTGGLGTATTQDHVSYFGIEPPRYEMFIGENTNAPGCPSKVLTRLAPGIHHVRIELDYSTARSLAFRGFLVLNTPLTGSQIGDSPGRAIVNGKVHTLSASHDSPLPTNSQDWDKGQRLIRYISKLGTRARATTEVPGFTDTGDVASASNTISSVGTIGQWRVGDLIMTINSGKKYYRRVVSISGTSLVCDSTFDYNQVGDTIYYLGRSFLTSAPSIGGSARYGTERPNESVAQELSVLDFVGPSVNLNGRGMSFINGTPTTTPIGSRLSDISTAITVTDTVARDIGSGAVMLAAASDEMRIHFVGTGISLLIEHGNADTHLYLDGCDLGLLPTQTLVNVMGRDSGGTFIAGELPYGQHVLRIVMDDASTSKIYGCTIWEPKKPEIAAADLPALELLDTNILGSTDEDLSIDEQDGPSGSPQVGAEYTQLGTVQLEVAGIIHPGDDVDDIVVDGFSTAFGTSSTSRVCTLGGQTTTDKVVYLPFYGKEITLVTQSITVGAGTLVPYLLDADGVYRAPGSTTGFTSTGPTSLGVSAVAGLRTRFTVDQPGLHVLMIVGDAASQDIEFDMIEVAPLFHTHQPKHPVWIDAWQPMQFSGRDLRPTVPFDERLLQPDGENYLCSFVAQKDGAPAADTAQTPFWFYSPGGLVEISVSAKVRDDTVATVTASIVVNEYTADAPVAQHEAVGTGGSEYVQLATKRVLYLPRGFHFARVDLEATAFMVDTVWTARSTPQSNVGPRRRRPYEGSGRYLHN
jgi:hypothetical protein